MNNIRKSILGLVCLSLLPLLTFTGCKEDIDDSDYAIADKNTIAQELDARSDLSYIKAIFERVRLGAKTEDAVDNVSSVYAVLSTRGNYTCFAPTNDAVMAHLQSLGKSSIEELTYEEAMLIALNAVIDSGDDSAFESPDFPQGGESFSYTNLADRRLTCSQDDANANLINGVSKLIEWDYEMSNGILHVVDAVISPSNDNIAELLGAADNMRIFAKLLQITDWADSLALSTDEENQYETDNRDYAGTTKYFASFNFPYMEKRAIGYTVLAETDSVYMAEWGVPEPQVDASGEITNWDAIYDIIKTKAAQIYTDASGDDPKDCSSAVNRFVAYHLLYGNMAIDEFVHHHNEYLYDYVNLTEPVRKNYSVNVWDYYTTMGPHRSLLKITHLPNDDNEYFINRISTHDNGIHGDYHEVSTIEWTANCGTNIQILTSNGDYDNNALNGFYFPIAHILVNDTQTRNRLASERIRMDLTTMLPEIASNDLRGRKVYYFPKGYFTNIMNESSSTDMYYLVDGRVTNNGSWGDYQGDEMLFSGRYDFVLRLPPVPQSGTYELRMGISLNTLRGMAQIYIGDDPNKTTPCGLPIDLRESISLIPGQPWVSDSGLDDETIYANDRALRNQNYMKGPQYFCVDGSGGKTPVRNSTTPLALRRILTTQYFDQNKTYYLRFKSAMESTTTQFFVDYFEYVKTDIVNDVIPEDIW